MLTLARLVPLVPCFALVACAGSDDKTTPTPTETGSLTTESTPTEHTGEPSGACGDPENFTIQITGVVVTEVGNPADGAVLELEDLAWVPGRILGTATADVYGVFTFEATNVTSLEDCWGTLLNYVLHADRVGPGGPQLAEVPMNTPLYNSISDGTLSVDLSAIPIVLEEAK